MLANIEQARNPFQISQCWAPLLSCSVASFLISCVGGREEIRRDDRLVPYGAGAGRARMNGGLSYFLISATSAAEARHESRRPVPGCPSVKSVNPSRPPLAFVCRCDAKARAGCGGVRGLPLLQAGHVEGAHRAHFHDRAEEGEKPTVTSPICPPTH